jgi:hypothetical protein
MGRRARRRARRAPRPASRDECGMAYHWWGVISLSHRRPVRFSCSEPRVRRSAAPNGIPPGPHPGHCGRIARAASRSLPVSCSPSSSSQASTAGPMKTAGISGTKGIEGIDGDCRTYPPDARQTGPGAWIRQDRPPAIGYVTSTFLAGSGLLQERRTHRRQSPQPQSPSSAQRLVSCGN